MSAETPDHPSNKVRRRDVVVGGLAGLVGLGGGAAAGRSSAPKPQPALPEGARPSYAQCGEDRILEMMLTYYGIGGTPSFMDIGSCDPVLNSNTYLLYTRGSRGLLVEPNPAFSDRIKAVRPGDTLLAAGIGISDAAEADYYVFNQYELNTFDPDQKDRLLREDRSLILKETIKLPLVNINRAIAEHLGGKAPDILSIDIEGLDLAVLKTLDFDRYRPQIVVAETLITLKRSHNPDTTPFMAARGYEVRAMTFPNTFYVDKKLLG